MGTVEIRGTRLSCGLAYGDKPGHCSWCGAALPAHRRRWCSERCARDFADNHRWPSARLAARERDGHRCREGCATLQLHVHHLEPVVGRGGYDFGCQHHLDGLVTLCEDHHKAEHRFMHEVELLVAWADGQPQRQLVLPGLAT